MDHWWTSRGKASKRWSICSAVNSCSHLNILTCRRLQKKSSSDLSSRRRLTPESNEFFCCNPLDTEIWPPAFFTFLREVASFSEFYPRQDVVVVVGDAVATFGVIKRHAYEEAASSSAAAPNRFVAFAMPSWVDRRMEATCAALREEAAAAKTAEKAALKAQKAALRAAVGC